MKTIKVLFIIEYKKKEYKILLVNDGCSYIDTDNGYKFIAKYVCPSLSATRAKTTLNNYLKTLIKTKTRGAAS